MNISFQIRLKATKKQLNLIKHSVLNDKLIKPKKGGFSSIQAHLVLSFVFYLLKITMSQIGIFDKI